MKIQCFILSYSKFFLSHLFCHFFSLMSVKIVTLSKKNFTQQFLPFSFCLYGLADICHTPRFFHCVHKKVVSCPLFFFVITLFLSCVVLLLFALMCFIFCILFGLVFRVGSVPSLVPQKALCSCSCGLRSVAVAPEYLYLHREAPC